MPDAATWRAPGRVNLIGEHTDYNGGFALPLAIAQGCTATARRAADGMLHLDSAQRRGSVRVPLAGLGPGAVGGWVAYPAGVVWALAERGLLPADFAGLDVHLDSDVPSGLGLSSSAALICALAGAVNDLLELGLSREELVALTHDAENDFVGAPTGGMDQMASLLCTPAHVLLCDMRDWTATPVPFDVEAAGLTLLVADTRAAHRHADGEYAQRRADCAEAARVLGVASLRELGPDDLDGALAHLPAELLRRRVRHVVTENERVLRTVELLRAEKLAEIGPLLTESHASMRDDYEITVPEVDAAVEALLAAGALGARMTGGGFGGCVIGLLGTDSVETGLQAVRAAFRRSGFARPAFFTAAAADGAHPVG